MDDSSASSAVAGKEETLPSTTSSDSTNINQTELSNFILECRPTLLQSRCWRNFKIDAKFLPSENYQLRNLLSACLTSSAFSYRMTCTCGRALLIYTVSILPQQRDSLSLVLRSLSPVRTLPVSHWSTVPSLGPALVQPPEEGGHGNLSLSLWEIFLRIRVKKWREKKNNFWCGESLSTELRGNISGGRRGRVRSLRHLQSEIVHGCSVFAPKRPKTP